jgi:hypothetical protein
MATPYKVARRVESRPMDVRCVVRQSGDWAGRDNLGVKRSRCCFVPEFCWGPTVAHLQFNLKASGSESFVIHRCPCVPTWPPLSKSKVGLAREARLCLASRRYLMFEVVKSLYCIERRTSHVSGSLAALRHFGRHAFQQSGVSNPIKLEIGRMSDLVPTRRIVANSDTDKLRCV